MNGFNALRQGILSFTGSLENIHNEREKVRLDTAKMKIERGITEARNQFELERIETERLRGLGEITPEEAEKSFNLSIQRFRKSFQDAVPNEVFEKKVSDSLMHEANSMVTNFENDQRKMFNAKDADRQIMEYNEIKRIDLQKSRILAGEQRNQEIIKLDEQTDIEYRDYAVLGSEKPNIEDVISKYEKLYDDQQEQINEQIQREHRPEIRAALEREEEAKREKFSTEIRERFTAVEDVSTSERIQRHTERQYQELVQKFSNEGGANWDLFDREVERVNSELLEIVSPLTGKNLNLKTFTAEQVLVRYYEDLPIQGKIEMLLTSEGLSNLNKARKEMGMPGLSHQQNVNLIVQRATVLKELRTQLAEGPNALTELEAMSHDYDQIMAQIKGYLNGHDSLPNSLQSSLRSTLKVLETDISNSTIQDASQMRLIRQNAELMSQNPQ